MSISSHRFEQKLSIIASLFLSSGKGKLQLMQLVLEKIHNIQ